ncbi:hypothetical protein CTAYLR_006127 [Chrysophaeum taylorii]|uniref:Rad4 beta-hairpin domain-containing protein n=1 Tax=Chrysophaeum taylorii TaxID=2483200 RepID=A0AAD7UQL6_9STRA|nr:hypothetical protein CTAYLR_006127 [Chrysophaeum taylorii]
MGDSDEEDGACWEGASSSSSEGEVPVPLAEEVEIGEPVAKKRKKKSAAELAEAAAWRRSRVAIHQAQLVATCCRLRLASEWCGEEMVVEAARALVPAQVVSRLKAAARGETSTRGAWNAVAQALRRARKERSGMRLGSEPATLARHALRGELDASEAAQVACALALSVGLDARLVVGTDPVACRRGRSPKPGFEVWARVGDCGVDRRFAYVIEYADGAWADITGDCQGVVPDKRRLPKSDRAWWPRTLAALNGGSARMSTGASLPGSRGAFRDHPAYALRSTLSKRERVDQTASSVGLFRGEPVYRRADVQTLRTQREWLRHFRRVREGEEGPLYGIDQTDEWTPDPVGDDGSLPVNAYGEIDVVDGDPNLVPKGAVWFKGDDAHKVAKALDLPRARVMVGWERDPSASRLTHSSSARPPRPKRDGVIVAERHAPALRAALEDHERRRHAAQRDAHQRRQALRWAKVVTKLLSRARLRAEYL